MYFLQKESETGDLFPTLKKKIKSSTSKLTIPYGIALRQHRRLVGSSAVVSQQGHRVNVGMSIHIRECKDSKLAPEYAVIGSLA